jgi:O-antigen ligase
VLFSPTTDGHSNNIFNPLFKANNAGGGFYSILFSLALAFYLVTKRKVYILVGICFLLFLWGTASRGSMMGAIAGILCYFLYQNGRKQIIYLMFGAVILTQTLILYHTYSYYAEYALHDSVPQLNNDFEMESGKEKNVYIRAYSCWPRALYLFFKSPLWGTGFGSFNDDSAIISTGDIPEKFVNITGDKVFNSAHAHHSFLHFLAEEGVMGLGIFLLFWRHLFTYIVSKQRKYSESIRIFLIMAFFNLTFMSFTEHRITTPSNAFPFVLPLVLALMYDNAHRQKSRSVCESQ